MASGDSLAELFPADYEPPTSNYATFDTRNGHPVLDFDGSTNETAIWTRWMPAQYDGGGVTVTISYMSEDTSGDIDWDVGFEAIADGGDDMDSDSFAAVNSTDGTTVPGTSGQPDYVTVTFTDGADMDSVAAGSMFRIKVVRDASNDTSTGDANLLGVLISET